MTKRKQKTRPDPVLQSTGARFQHIVIYYMLINILLFAVYLSEQCTVVGEAVAAHLVDFSEHTFHCQMLFFLSLYIEN